MKTLLLPILFAVVVWAGLTGCAASPRGGGGAAGSASPANATEGSKLVPRDIHVSPDQRIKAGIVLRDAGQLDAAMREFDRVLESNPNSVDAIIGVGTVQHAQRRTETARDTFTRAVDLDANRYDARYYLGLMQQVLGELGEAIVQYRRALEINPDDAATHRDLATAYLQVGRPDLALPHAEAATRLEPSNQPAWCNLAATYSLLGRFDDALRCYRTATEIGSLDAPVLLGLGDTHLKLENFQRAVNTLAELVRRYPTAVAHERFGYALFRTYQFEQSIDQFRTALRYNPDETAALNGLGACLITDYYQQENLRRKAKLHEALAAWRRSLRLQPDQPRIVELLARFDRSE
jgi:tetratricopeptide (TPR) repeat protein